MTNETKELFDAPWEADKFVYYRPSGIGEINIRVKSSKNELVAGYVTTTETANRLARLPELYDALMEAMQYHCSSCVGFDVSDIPISNILKNCQRVDCCAHRWLKLLQKVRDGE
jgi:hypothetical protein